MANKDCRTCANLDIPANQEPCNSCRAVVGAYTLWTAVPAPAEAVAVQHVGVGQPVHVVGRKDDGGKLDLTLFWNDLPHAIEAVTEVLQWAVTKKQPVPYERGSWQMVDDFQRRYQGALLRHQLAKAKAHKAGNLGEPTDHETGLLELAHIATDAMFMLEMAVRKAKGLNVPEGA